MPKEGVWDEEHPGSSLKEFHQLIAGHKAWACKADREQESNQESDVLHKPKGKRH